MLDKWLQIYTYHTELYVHVFDEAYVSEFVRYKDFSGQDYIEPL